MADLDDFFAKKDRKKSKSVKKFATADELAKKLEDTKQKPDVRPKKERPAQEGEETGRAGVCIISESHIFEFIFTIRQTQVRKLKSPCRLYEITLKCRRVEYLNDICL